MSPQIYEKYLPWRPASGSPKNYICGEKIPVARALLVGIVVFLFSSCFDKGDCLITNSTLINIDFKKKTNSSLDTAIRFTSIEIIGSDTVLYSDDTKKHQQVNLPVDPFQTEAGFIFHYPDSIRMVDNKNDTIKFKSDTLKFSYRNETVILNSDCPALTYQKDLIISKTTHDSTLIRVINNQLLKDAINFEILY
ncbi:MAG TPA: hypothetical protein VIT44_08545 [Cyclobacteriaceae bacterium]